MYYGLGLTPVPNVEVNRLTHIIALEYNNESTTENYQISTITEQLSNCL